MSLDNKMTTIDPQKLPTELILRIVDSLGTTAVALCLKHNAIAKSIRTFTLVSRATYPVALRMLYRHCLWIDSSEKLRRLLHSLDAHFSPQRSSKSTLPHVDLAPSLCNLYLSPFDHGLDDIPTAVWVYELCARMRRLLRRLVVDMPLSTLHYESDRLDVLPKLRAAFLELECVEELAAADDAMFLSGRTGFGISPLTAQPVWSNWRKLQRLALYNTDLCRDNRAYLDAVVRLGTLALAQSVVNSGTSVTSDNFMLAVSQSDITILDVICDHTTSKAMLIWPSGEKTHPLTDDLLHYRFVQVWLPYRCGCGKHNEGDITTSWVKHSALDGTLWDLRFLKCPPVEPSGVHVVERFDTCNVEVFE